MFLRESDYVFQQMKHNLNNPHCLNASHSPEIEFSWIMIIEFLIKVSSFFRFSVFINFEILQVWFLHCIYYISETFILHLYQILVLSA